MKQTGPGDKPRVYKKANKLSRAGILWDPTQVTQLQGSHLHRRSPNSWEGGRCRTARILEERSPNGEGSGIRSLPRSSGQTQAGTAPPGPPCGARPPPAPAPAHAHVRVLGAGHDVRLELCVVKGRRGADQPPVLLAAGVDLELRQATWQFVARQSAPHLRAEGQGGQGCGGRAGGSWRQTDTPAPRTLLAPGSSRRLGCSRRKARTSAGTSFMAGRPVELEAVRHWNRVEPGPGAGLGGAPEAVVSRPGNERRGDGCGGAVAGAAAARGGCRAGERGGRAEACRAG